MPDNQGKTMTRRRDIVLGAGALAAGAGVLGALSGRKGPDSPAHAPMSCFLGRRPPQH